MALIAFRVSVFLVPIGFSSSDRFFYFRLAFPYNLLSFSSDIFVEPSVGLSFIAAGPFLLGFWSSIA
jgi:hypothetical protein